MPDQENESGFHENTVISQLPRCRAGSCHSCQSCCFLRRDAEELVPRWFHESSESLAMEFGMVIRCGVAWSGEQECRKMDRSRAR